MFDYCSGVRVLCGFFFFFFVSFFGFLDDAEEEAARSIRRQSGRPSKIANFERGEQLCDEIGGKSRDFSCRHFGRFHCDSYFGDGAENRSRHPPDSYLGAILAGESNRARPKKLSPASGRCQTFLASQS